MNQPQPTGIAALAALVSDLTKQVTNLASEVAKLRGSVRWNWRIVLVDILLTLGLAAVGGGLYHAATTADVAQQVAAVARRDAAQVKAQEMAFCQASNVSREQSIKVWNKLLSLSMLPPPGTKAAKLINEFVAYYKYVYRPRDCATLGQPTPSPSALPGGVSR